MTFATPPRDAELILAQPDPLASESDEEGEGHLRAVTDALPVLVSFVDTDKRYRFVSAAYERWFGQPQAAFLGRTMADVLGADAYSVVEPYVAKALSGQSVTFESEVPYRDGGARYVDATYIPRRSPHGDVTGFVVYVADATERRAQERLRAAAADRADKLLRVTAGIADAVSADEVYVALVDRVVEALGTSSGGLWLVDDAAGVATLARSVGYTTATSEKLATIPLDMNPSIPALDCIRRNAPVWIDTKADLLSAYPHLDALVTPQRRYRVACLPLSAQGHVRGVLALTIESEGTLSGEERAFLLLVARYATQAIERLRLLDAERKSRADADAAANRLRVLGRASRAFVEADLSLDVRLQVVVSELSETVHGSVNIALIQPDGRLHFAAVRHPDAEANAWLETLTRSAPLTVGEGITGAIAATGRSILLPQIDPGEISSKAPAEYREFLRRYPIYALIGAPLQVQGRVIGTVTATKVMRGETYDEADLALLEDLADRAAVAIENSRLYDETVAARARADLLYAFAHSVSIAERLGDVYEAALDTISKALGTPRLAILIMGDDERPHFTAWRELSDEYRRAVDGHSPWPRDAKHFAPVLVHDVRSDPAMAPFVALFEREQIRALGFFPLVIGGALLGKFMVYFRDVHHFQAHEIEVATSIANHLASVTKRFATMSRLEETLSANEMFAGVLAHDLRNPLSAIMYAAELMLMRQEGAGSSGGDASQSKPLGRILRSGQRMTVMIDQLLDFTRARSGGGIQVSPRPVNLADICDQAIAELELAHPDWNIRSEVKGSTAGNWDGDRLLQVVSNLVANAGTHGTQGGEIEVIIDGTQPREVRLVVRNEGLIPESIRGRAFDPFLGSHRSEQASVGGLGLGLFIVREIVRAHLGEVAIESVDRHTTVDLRLPR